MAPGPSRFLARVVRYNTFMCGRYTLTTPGETLATLFDLPEPPDFGPRYNIAPTQPVAIVTAASPALRVVQWGLVPSWAKDPSIGARMINARSETAAEKPSFRAAFKRRRCLIPADGFYEWRKTSSGPKQPYWIALADKAPFAFAGLWEQWESPEGFLESCTILTSAANALLAHVHDRMPVILPRDCYDRWLHTLETEARSLQSLLRPFDAAAMRAWPVSTTVNSPRNETPECVTPIGVTLTAD